jgi:hypothetical protein
MTGGNGTPELPFTASVERDLSGEARAPDMLQSEEHERRARLKQMRGTLP